jgi:hypothetical protein
MSAIPGTSAISPQMPSDSSISAARIGVEFRARGLEAEHASFMDKL